MMEKNKTIMPLDWPLEKRTSVKCVGKKGKETPKKITLKLTIWKALFFLVISAKKLSGAELVLVDEETITEFVFFNTRSASRWHKANHHVKT